MPIEIRELIIKVTVYDDDRPPGGPPGATGLREEDVRQLRKELTDSCVRQVLQELNKRRER